jgi:tetratricopeptide (TPR) repeat protein
LLYSITYFALGSRITDASNADLGDRVSALADFGWAACVAMALLLALPLGIAARRRAASAAPAGDTSQRRNEARITVPAFLLLGVALAVLAFIDVRADSGADARIKLSLWSQNQGRPDAAVEFARQAMAMVPMERRFAGTYANRLVAAAMGYFSTLATHPENAATAVDKFQRAEAALLAARALAPRDPWLTYAYGNVEQFLSTKMLEAAQAPGERARHAALARQYLGLAHEQFPGHPWIVRSLAQNEIEQGDHAAALAWLTRMQAMDPRNIEGYVEWIRFARLDAAARAAAVMQLRHGLELMPRGSSDEAALLQMQIDVARQSGDINAAIAAAQEYTTRQPDRVAAWRQLGEFYEINQQRDLALGNAQATLARFEGKTTSRTDATDLAAVQLQILRLNNSLDGAGGRLPTAGSSRQAQHL